ncbi:MAG: O-antigen ligase family protein [Hydrogenophaga sp.]|nr:O-antigen ligase family protein [Hydrogenophaga sp.]
MTSSSAPESPAQPPRPGLAVQRAQAGLLTVAAAGWALSPMGSTWPGLAWLALCLAALLGLCNGTASSADVTACAAARRWWWATSFAMVLAGGALLAHGDPWSSLQDNTRLWLGAGAALLLVRRWQGHAGVPHVLMDTCAAACTLGALVALTHQRDQLPGNAIPWAVSVAFLLCVLAPAVLDRNTDWSRRRWWAVGLVLGLAAVLASQTRGALVITLWLAWLLLRHLWVHRPVGAPRSLAALAVALVVFGSSAWWDADPLRLREAGHDIALALTQDQPDTAVGSRLEMWSTAVQGIAQSPWLGHGISGRETAMRELGDQHAPHIWATLTHFHNEYLNAWFDHGLPGLGAVLVTLAGLMAAAQALRQHQPVASQQLWGLAVVHGVAGLTNVNTVHNLYTLALSLAASAVLLRAAHTPSQPQTVAP